MAQLTEEQVLEGVRAELAELKVPGAAEASGYVHPVHY